MNADAVNLRQKIATPDGLGVFGVDDAIAVAALAMQLFPTLGKSPGKENYKKVFKPNADKFVAFYMRDFVTGANAVGYNASAIAVALSDKLAEQGVLLSPQQLAADATPSTASIATAAGSNIATGAGSFIQSLTGGNPTPYIIAGGAGLVLLLLLRK